MREITIRTSDGSNNQCYYQDSSPVVDLRYDCLAREGVLYIVAGQHESCQAAIGTAQCSYRSENTSLLHQPTDHFSQETPPLGSAELLVLDHQIYKQQTRAHRKMHTLYPSYS